MAEGERGVLKVLRHGGPVSREAVATGARLSPEEVGKLLRTMARQGTVDWLPDARTGWLATAPVINARVPAAIHRILDVAGPLRFRTLRGAWRRQTRLKGFVPFPESDDVLTAWFDRFGEFARQGDRVGVRTPGLIELDSTAQLLVSVLAEHPDGVTRAVLREQCLSRGMPAGTFATTLTYSPLVTAVARDLWMLVSERVNEAHVRRVQAPIRKSKRVTYEWTSDGDLQLTAFVSSLESPVIHVPREVTELLEGKRFDTTDGTTNVREGVAIKAGTVWGFSPFLSRENAAAGDLIRLRFDLLSRTVALHLVRARDGGVQEVPLS